MKNTSNSARLRADAALVLFQILEQGKSSRECLPEVQQHHQAKDKAWIQEMVFGVLRQLPILQFWLRQLLDKPLKNRNKVVEHLLMLGFYQLAFSRVSDHAAVSETVSACQPLKNGPMKGLVNAILRNFMRQEMVNNQPDNPQIQSGLPKWLYKKLLAAYPNNLTQIIADMHVKAPLWIRVNSQKCSRESYTQLLIEADHAPTQSDKHKDALILTKAGDVTQLPGYDDGFFAIQDGAAQLAADYLSPQAGEHVLDCCAAPGGKTCHVLERQPDLATCTALDFDEKRLTRVEENLHRLGHQANIICGDAAKPDTWWNGQEYDRILLDAPCSATGVIRRHPDIKWLRKRQDIEVLVELQQQIIQAIWPLLKSGGTMLYATCSVLPEENTHQMAKFLAENSDATLSPITNEETPEKPGRQILPSEQQMDGFYYCRLIKS